VYSTRLLAAGAYKKGLEEKMNKTLSSIAGIGLILLGIAALAGDTLFSWIAPNFHFWDALRLWPLLVVGTGLFLAVLGLGAVNHRGLGTFFIPAVPTLITGGMLIFASLFNHWDVWSLLWPLEVLGLAGGFLLAAIFARNVWLGIPAILIGLNGLVLAFCNTTGLWGSWSVLWTVEPLAVGLVLLLVAAKTRSLVVTVIGVSICAFAFLAFSGMTALLAFNGLMYRIGGPAFLVLMGGGLLLWSLVKRPVVVEQGNAVTPMQPDEQ
jgi:hypothetical protein